MALSNYDHAAWNKFGDPCGGIMKFPGGIEIEVYKDWLYIHDYNIKSYGRMSIEIIEGDRDSYESLTPVSASTSPAEGHMIIHVTEGEINYNGTKISVHRGRDGSMFFYAESCKFQMGDGYEYTEVMPIILFGIGKYGFEEDEWIGVTPDDVKHLLKWLKEIGAGVTEITSCARYNPGDIFLCSALGIEPNSVITKCGESGMPVLGQMFGMKNKAKSKKLHMKKK